MSPNVTGRTCNTKPLYNNRRRPRTFFASFASFVAKVSHPPKLQHSQKRKQPAAPKRRGKMPHVRRTRRFPHSVLANGHGVRHPKCKGWWGYGWFLTGFTGFAGLTGLRDDGRNAKERRACGAERGGKGEEETRRVLRRAYRH